ncbi:MAG: Plasmid stabilization system protein [Pelotomaculum sp. PtaB.Bin013]|uniref:Type II toxin-antitoxin system RelE/ParE family toxin n=1 Tax=Pelotomaculum isophthalicicum JI TaxID=947010 RepID=A0A9X4H108_9FIRM|nr:type II toxin-antitoxin system RelE/ParE family toxin [Pelotomaculum isophthalicicum]MDF9407731.1 type II toxin-antitoxin system RelE/ParE family toxin [Pelotomaculum isophthalicicum JI]OPX83378.1 MAG: Plasmid stabilization system protein [Pelotomaculum sp. PtaB.Bin013]
MHKIKYIPLALKDLRDITDYITGMLKAPKAATDLLDALDASISRLAQFPYSCRLYQPAQPLEGEYRILPVKNYLVFYVVTELEVEIRRIIYAKMDIAKIIR